MRRSLAPLSWLYDGVGRVRNHLYNQGKLKARRLPTTVVSVGNLTVGGTGKTPTTEFLVKLLKEQNISCAVLSRGYGGNERSVMRVPAHGERADLAHRFGDEPTWLAQRHPDVPVYIGRDRYQAGLFLLERDPVRVLILDDALQHRKLFRNINIVLVDATEKVEEFAVLPLGRAREGLYGLKRAQVVILTKANLASLEQRRAWVRVIRENTLENTPILEFEYRLSGLLDPATGRTYMPEELKGERVLLFSGLAKPQVFEDQILSQVAAQVVGHQRFVDHYVYSEADMIALKKQARDCNWLIQPKKI